MMLKILVVDDEPEIVNALKGFFVKKGYEVYVAGDGSTALDLVKKHRPHLVFLDIRMPKVDGLKVLRNIRQMDTSIKVIMVTAFGTQEVIKEAGRIGAVDFICKPFTLNYLEHDVMAKVSVQLFDDLRQEMDGKVKLISQLENLNGRVSRNFYQTMLSLAAALESRDRYTHGHSERVDHYSKLIAQELKTNPKLKMDNKFLEDLHMESRLHDIGKIAVPDEILNKPGKLTAKEFNEIKRHPSESARILAPLEGVKDSIDVIYNHHERIDGRGYPEGRSGKDIPLRAKIIAVADAFDAMTSDRPYRRAIPENLALNELEKNRDRQFDGKVVNAFLNIRKKKEKLAKEEVLLNT
ncbi:MAG: response regulator [Candidatus Omnitrophica bacterium]|nr:response regulator [Candidatus Omnitrophota bacterium]MBU1925565.1 response regulator [Candidatus Omnitrophota bacterium]